MKATLPKWINPYTLAKQGTELAGSLSVADMSRLSALLSRPVGEVELKLRFGQDLDRGYSVHGSLYAKVPLLCERCGQEFQYPLMAEPRLRPVMTEAQADKLPAEYEPLLVNEEQKVELVHLVEEELILALPMFAKHVENECSNRKQE